LKLSVAQRKFFTEVAALIDKTVIVATTTGKTFTGTLIGINPDSLSLAISEAKDEAGQVKLYEDKGFIWVMDKVKLTEKGVVEGSGPAAERVQRVYSQFMSEAKS
jgi:small nuclear ribonucleoprotein (snRNP)-like protein